MNWGGLIMDRQSSIEKTRATIRTLLSILGKKVGRTVLVKLVYFADNGFYQSTGRTITGNLYMWDHHGPNAVGHAIANEADKLAACGVIRMAVGQSIYGGPSFQYWVDDPRAEWRDASALLDDGERQILLDVAKRFRRSTMASIVKRSKDTTPFANAEQYDVLNLEEEGTAKQATRKLEGQGAFLEEVALGLDEAEAGDWVWDDQIDSFTTS